MPEAPNTGLEDAEDDPTPAPRPRRAATVVAVVVVVLALVGILSLALSVKLYLEHKAAIRTLEATISSVAVLSTKIPTSERVQKRLAWLQKSVDRRDWQQAAQAIEALNRPDVVTPPPGTPGLDDPLTGGEGPGAQLPDPTKVQDLPAEARGFFAQNPKAWAAFLGFTQAGIRMRDAGIEVDELRDLRSQMVEAARLGQKEQLTTLLTQARGIIEKKTGPEATSGFEAQMRAFGQAFGQAQKQRRDVRPAGQLAAQAERAAREGEMGRARELIVKATEALKKAPRMRMPRPMRMGARPMPQQMMGGPEMGFLQFLSQTLNSVMQMERADLANVWKQVQIAADAIRENNADQIREILGGALGTIDSINVRRQQMSDTIQQAQEAMLKPREQSSQPRRPSPEEMMRKLQERIDLVLGDARAMSDEEFEQAKPRLAAALLDVLMPRQQGPERPGPSEAELTPEERVRTKMQMIADPYAHLKRAGADTTELDKIFSEARDAITQHDYEAAEKLVDGSLPLLDQLLQAHPPVPPGEEAGDAAEKPPTDSADGGTTDETPEAAPAVDADDTTPQPTTGEQTP